MIRSTHIWRRRFVLRIKVGKWTQHGWFDDHSKGLAECVENSKGCIFNRRDSGIWQTSGSQNHLSSLSLPGLEKSSLPWCFSSVSMAAVVSRISSSTGSCWPAIGRSAAVGVDSLAGSESFLPTCLVLHGTFWYKWGTAHTHTHTPDLDGERRTRWLRGQTKHGQVARGASKGPQVLGDMILRVWALEGMWRPAKA